MKVSPILVALAFSPLTVAVWADPGNGAPVAESVPINVQVDPNTPFNGWWPNVFDLNEKKRLTFAGTITQQLDPTGAPIPGTLVGFFDWRDEQANELLSPPFTFSGSPGQPVEIQFSWTVDFCPREVSLHFETLDGTFNVVGTFTHECLIPEASTVVPSVALAVGMLGWAWRRRPTSA